MDFVDTHCHIQSAGRAGGEPVTSGLWTKAPELTVEEIIKTASSVGVNRMICVGCDLADSQLAVDFVEDQPNCCASVGIHPHEAIHYTNNKTKLLKFEKLLSPDPQPSYLNEAQATTPRFAKSEPSASSFAGSDWLTLRKIVGIGECGLDYFYNHSPKAAQFEVLKFQIKLAQKHNLPMIFHVREAFDDFWPIFDELNSVGGKIRGVLHSFTDNTANLEKALNRGLFIGVNGIATFTKNQAQLNMYKAVPLANLLLETDAPFLAPVPYRGSVNQPARVATVAEFLSQLRDQSVDEIAQATTANAIKLFNLKPGD